jgi:hypothetical protein
VAQHGTLHALGGIPKGCDTVVAIRVNAELTTCAYQSQDCQKLSSPFKIKLQTVRQTRSPVLRVKVLAPYI